MLSALKVNDLASTLAHAERDRRPIEPLTSDHELSILDAYAIQRTNVDRKVAAGDKVRGHKVGLSARAMQRLLGVYEPDFGQLLASMFINEGETVPYERFVQPRAEIEVAFVLGRPLAGPGVTVADVLRATDHLLPSIEIVDSRIADWRIRIEDTIADNASSGAVVLGARPTRIYAVDPALIGAILVKNGELVQTGCTGAVLGNPVNAVAWLANKVADFGVCLEEGDVVLPGSCTRMVPFAPGDVIRADFDQLGHVTVSFAASEPSEENK